MSLQTTRIRCIGMDKDRVGEERNSIWELKAGTTVTNVVFSDRLEDRKMLGQRILAIDDFEA